MEFNKLTVFVLANNETELLRCTVSSIKKACKEKDLNKIIIVCKSDKCLSFFEGNKMAQEDPLIENYVQRSPTAQLCLAELPGLVTSSHFVIMAADMEMDPANLTEFIAGAKRSPGSIICAAKWLKESTVIGYGGIHAFCSKTMNRIISLLFNQKVYDPFSIYQIYPLDLYHKMNFDSPADFLYEYTLKPLSMGAEYKEIPTVYRKREEGKSNFNFLTLFQVGFKFIYTGFRIKFDCR